MPARQGAPGALSHIDGRVEQGDTFWDDRFPDLEADHILTNFSFNMKPWGGKRLREARRWPNGVQWVGNSHG